MLSDVVNVVVISASVCVAITNIVKFIKKPADVVKSNIDERKQIETTKLTQDITQSIMSQVEPLIDEVKQINLRQNKEIEKLTHGQLDLLRDRILHLYNYNKEHKSLTQEEMEQLHTMYQDYTDEGGNSFVHKLYEIMLSWDII